MILGDIYDDKSTIKRMYIYFLQPCTYQVIHDDDTWVAYNGAPDWSQHKGKVAVSTNHTSRFITYRRASQNSSDKLILR